MLASETTLRATSRPPSPTPALIGASLEAEKGRPPGTAQAMQDDEAGTGRVVAALYERWATLAPLLPHSSGSDGSAMPLDALRRAAGAKGGPDEMGASDEFLSAKAAEAKAAAKVAEAVAKAEAKANAEAEAKAQAEAKAKADAKGKGKGVVIEAPPEPETPPPFQPPPPPTYPRLECSLVVCGNHNCYGIISLFFSFFFFLFLFIVLSLVYN